MDLPEITNMEHFISMIGQRPALWDRSLLAYTNKKVREQNWREIMVEFFPDYNDWDVKKQTKSLRRVIKRWSQMRDNYIKSEKKRLSLQSTKSLKKPVKPYRYHREMKFLIPVLQLGTSNKPSQNASSEEISSELVIDPRDTIGYNDTSIKLEDDSSNSNEEGNIFSDSSNDTLIQPTRGLTNEGQTRRSSTTDAHGQRHMLFFQGIIPSLEMLDEDQILEFQIGVLKLIKQVKNI